VSQNPIRAQLTVPISVAACRGYMNELPLRVNPFILGGEPAEPGDYPHMVSCQTAATGQHSGQGHRHTFSSYEMSMTNTYRNVNVRMNDYLHFVEYSAVFLVDFWCVVSCYVFCQLIRVALLADTRRFFS